MSLSRRITIITTSIFLLLIITISLTLSLEIRLGPPRTIIQISLAEAQAQAQKLEELDRDLVKGKAKINGSDFDRADIIPAPTVYLPVESTTLSSLGRSVTTSVASSIHLGDELVEETPNSFHLEPIAGTSTAASVDQGEGLIGETPTPQPTPTSLDQGSIGPIITSHTPAQSPSQSPPATPSSTPPIFALSYAGGGGPQHCRGTLIQKLLIPYISSSKTPSEPSTSSPTRGSIYTNGTCVTLLSPARCGVFFASKEAGCEADLYNSEDCVRTGATYVNTVVFMPEERPVGAYWRSMWVTCGIVGKDVAPLDPVLLEGLVKGGGG